MKIIQLLARIDGSGVTRYVIELNKALMNIGNEVEIISLKTGFKDGDSAKSTQTIDNAIEMELNDKTLQHINEADLVIINSIIDRRAEIREQWIDFVQNKITVKKVIVVNDHKPVGFNAYYGDLLKRPKFWLSFDKICTFSYDARVYKKIREIIGEDESTKRFISLELPYTMNDNVKDNWIKFEDKVRRVTYIGRHAPFKDNHRLVRCCDPFWKHNYELEMHGIKRTINLAITPNILYEFDEKGNVLFETEGPNKGKRKESKICTIISNTWKKAHGIDLNDNMIYSPERDKNKIYVFGEYKRNDGLNICKCSAFCCDFFHLDYKECYGDCIEYAINEIMECGSIALLDYDAAKSVYLHDGNGNNTGISILDSGICIPLKNDGSNIDECLQKMDELMNNPDKYNKMRNKAFDLIKKHSNPKVIAERFLKDCF